MKETKLDKEVLDRLIQYLLTQPLAKKSPSGTELGFRCPFCGDSTDDPNKISFSININQESSNFLRYQCFRAVCLTTGNVNEEFLSMIGFDSYDCVKAISKFNYNKISKGPNIYVGKKAKELHNVINTNSKMSELKLKYVNNRLGLNLSFKDIYDLKINLNFSELLKFNEIDIPSDKTYYYQKLSDYGISFISAYNDYAIIRDVSKSGKIGKRYTNINIFNNYDNVTKSYMIPGNFDIMSTKPIVLNVSEGAFDIIGVKYNLDIDKKYDNQIYAAACGAGILNTIFRIVRQYGLINVKINIFSDNDVPIETYYEINVLEKYLYDYNINVYYNTLEKDFGVTPDKISYIKTRL